MFSDRGAPARANARRRSPLPLALGLAFGLALSFASARSAAQIVNVQPLISAETEKKEGPSLVIDGSADIRRGNTSLFSVSGSAIGQYRSGRHLVFLLARGDFAQSGDAPIANKDLEHLRYRLGLIGPLLAEVFVQHDRDAFRRLSLRAIGGVGPRARIAWFSTFDAAVGVAYMFEHERLAEGDYRDSGATMVNHRLSSYFVISTRIPPNLELGLTAYLQPRLDSFRDVRVLSESSALARATKHLSLKLTLTSAFDSLPPAGVVPLDTTFKGSIQASF
jgi:hypothetical protein